MNNTLLSWTRMLTLSLFLGSTGYAGNIALADPSFESGSLSGTQGTTVSGWFAFGSAGVFTVSGDGFWADMSGVVGTRAAYAVSNSATDGVPIYQTVELDAGVTYRLTAAFGTNSAAPKNDAIYALQIWDAGFTSLQASQSGTQSRQAKE